MIISFESVCFFISGAILCYFVMKLPNLLKFLKGDPVKAIFVPLNVRMDNKTMIRFQKRLKEDNFPKNVLFVFYIEGGEDKVQTYDNCVIRKGGFIGSNTKKSEYGGKYVDEALNLAEFKKGIIHVVGETRLRFRMILKPILVLTGHLKNEDKNENFVSIPKNKKVNLSNSVTLPPLALLCSEFSMSTSYVFIDGLKKLKYLGVVGINPNKQVKLDLCFDNVLFDTGAPYNAISYEYFKEIWGNVKSENKSFIELGENLAVAICFNTGGSDIWEYVRVIKHSVFNSKETKKCLIFGNKSFLMRDSNIFWDSKSRNFRFYEKGEKATISFIVGEKAKIISKAIDLKF